MRLKLVGLCLFVFVLGLAQGQGPQSLFMTTRVQASVVITPSQIGMQNVAVTILKPTYSHALLQAQIDRLGQELGFAPRGVQIFDYSFDRSDPTANQVRASFGVSGLMEPDTGVLHVEPIARAFAISQGEDVLDAIMVEFKNIHPTDRTIKSCAPPAPGCSGMELEGRAEQAPEGVEYRLKYLEHDPVKITIADKGRPKAADTAAKPPKTSTDWTLIGLIGLAAVAVGALVYSLLLRGRPARRP